MLMCMRARVGVFIALVLVLAAPFFVRTVASRGAAGNSAGEGSGPGPGGATLSLVVVSPHVEQIQLEFSSAFDRWHRREHGRGVAIDWRQPGGTSDIIKQLEASFDSAARKGLGRADGSFPPGTAGFDVFFGGGSFEHGKMKERKSALVSASGQRVEYRMGQPAGFPQATLDAWFGENTIGVQKLYDPEQYWIGTALSGFGIVFNRDVLRELGLSEPESFQSLADPRYFNMLAIADGRQSGSVTTTFESILNSLDWDKGWRLLRDVSANARYFASAATRIPVDVGQGEAAAGVAIDFYGRGQAQFLQQPGEDDAASRVGYIDPAGATYIDADPVSILNGCRDVELAKRLIEFALSEEGQALWQFRALAIAASAGNPMGPGGRKLGPDVHELRRMPVRRVMYEKYGEHFVDRTDPFAAASKTPSRGWRSAIGPMMAAFGIDTRPELRAAWQSLNRMRAVAALGTSPEMAGVVTHAEAAFYAMPPHTLQAGSIYSSPAILDKIDRKSVDELVRARVTTFDQLDRHLKSPAATKASSESKAAWELIASRRGLAPAEAVTLTFDRANFAAIRADTDSWRDPLHGRRSLISYADFFRSMYRSVLDIEARTGVGR
jgi:iron(III) transport system substrate-binding protein